MAHTPNDATGDAQESSPGHHHQNIAASSFPTTGISATAAEDCAEPLTTSTEMQPADSGVATSTPLPSLTTIDCSEAQPFRLLDLPDELWTKIGKMVIDELPVTDIDMHGLFEDDDTTLNPERFAALKVLAPGVKPPAILQTCSSLRKELRLDYYKSKITVSMEQIPYKKQELVGMYLRSIGADARKEISGSMYGGLVKKAFPTPRLPMVCFEDWEIEVELTAERTTQDWTEDCEILQWNITFL
ncbi:unnamed protein product [Zymoseptoria tritici ST99CH_3D7]|uniref:F-box domain-containing protein n=1 Tax=Zymoseptoria tritici (strain ST99CH_3D7) TaxID=1276538 RepID=A0A1X7RTR4_ZYMT9|nr:unnamed protein product [Zymoseptoria tritici ST99CH_3D7]